MSKLLVLCFLSDVPPSDSLPPGSRCVQVPRSDWSLGLSRLLSRYAYRYAPDRIVLHGFSAGFIAVRECLRSTDMLSDVAAVVLSDTLHLPRRPPAKTPLAADEAPTPDTIAHWADLAEPFAQFARRAADGQALYVSHWSDGIVGPGPPANPSWLTSSAAGNRAVWLALRQARPRHPGPEVPDELFRPPPSAAGWAPPVELYGSGPTCLGLGYSRGDMTPARAHVVQGTVIAPHVWRTVVGPWLMR